jgi:hypothetical protein
VKLVSKLVGTRSGSVARTSLELYQVNCFPAK